MASVHSHEVDVDVDEEIALGGAPVHFDFFAVLGDAEQDHVLGIFGIVVVERAVGCECVVDAIADGVAQLGFGHASMQRERGDEVNVVDAGLGGHVEHRFDDALADIGLAHRGQRQRNVVERDGELHARTQQRGQRVAIDRVKQRIADGAVGVGQSDQRVGGVQDSRAAGRQLLEAESLAVVKHDRRRRLVDVQHETGSRGTLVRSHQRSFRCFSLRMSKAILTAPRGPALAACSIASS